MHIKLKDVCRKIHWKEPYQYDKIPLKISKKEMFIETEGNDLNNNSKNKSMEEML